MPGFENDLLALLSDVARHMRTYGSQLAHQHGVTLGQLMILERLEQESEISQDELAGITELSPIAVVRLIDRLIELGLVKRCADPEERRMCHLRLTPAAASLARAIKTLRAELFLVATKGINASALGVTARALRQMKENVTHERLVRASA
jgi:MarR family transcriptional regulator, transcriptional regulator for hemolysin